MADAYDAMSSHRSYRKAIPQQLVREPFCRECAKAGRRTPAEVVDHIRPHRGDWDLFKDPSNFQSLCKTHHDQKTALEQLQDRRDAQRK